MCAPEAPVVGAPEETSVNAPMAVATTFAPEEAQLSLPKAPKLEEAAVSVSRDGGNNRSIDQCGGHPSPPRPTCQGGAEERGAGEERVVSLRASGCIQTHPAPDPRHAPALHGGVVLRPRVPSTSGPGP